MTNLRVSWLVLACASGNLACSQTERSKAQENSAKLDSGEWLPGGATTNTLLFGSNAFTKPAENITPDNEARFFSGNSFFNQSWVQAPASTENRDGLGPLFNARSCASCHFKDGRGRPPLTDGEAFSGLLLRLSVPGQGSHGEPVADATYGGQLQPLALPDVLPEATPLVQYAERRGNYDDGEPYTLLEPSYVITAPAYGELRQDLQVSPRVAPAVIGLGLLEAIELSRLQELEDADDADGDGISGRLNWVWDVSASELRPGRFGWKAEQPSVRQQSAAAFLGDMGITSSLFPEQDCSERQTECKAALSGGAPEIDDDELERVDVYARLLAVPARHGYDQAQVLEGKMRFSEIGCASCHVPRHITDPGASLAEVAGQTIWPYTDLLLHDLGRDLSDDRPSFAASGSEWRTPPLWGIGRYQDVNGHDRLLHDGRARGVAEAILWHGGEAEGARDAFKALAASERRGLVAFVESL